MSFIFVLALALHADTFTVQAELQGLYDEISQATLQFVTGADVDQFHDVLYTADWVFIDASGGHHDWRQVREAAVQALAAPHPAAILQPIQKLSVAQGGATAVVQFSTVRTVVDDQGQYGRKGGTHRLTETTTFRDAWVSIDGMWKLKSREQISAPKTVVDKPLY